MGENIMSILAELQKRGYDMILYKNVDIKLSLIHI